MGRKFTNIQVLVGDRPIDEVREAVAGVYRKRMRAKGFAEVAASQPTDQEEERSVYFAWHEDSRWLTACDVESEFGSVEMICELVEEISAATSDAAIGVRVFDSDVLELYYYRDGTRIDCYSNEPDHPEVGATSRRRKKDFTGRPERWRDLLVGNATPETLREVFASQPLFAEERLDPLAPLIGGQKGWGWDSWESGESDRQDALRQGRAPAYSRLTFRLAQPSPAPRVLDGPPVLTVIWGGMGGDASVGYPFDRLDVTVANGGGAMQGLGITLYGSALDEGLIEPTRIDAMRMSRGRHGPGDSQKFAANLMVGQSDGLKVRYAALPDLAMPARTVPATGEAPVLSSIGHTPDDFVSFTIYGETKCAGEGSLWLGVIPTEHPTGRTDWHFAIKASEPARRPLRASADVRPALWRTLLPSSNLSGLIALGRDRATLAPLVASAVERWWKTVAANDTRQCYAWIQRAPNLKPASLRCQAQHLLRQKRWPEWREALVSCESLQASVDLAMPRFEFGALTNQIRPLPEDVELVSYLSFGCDLAGRDANEQAQIIATLFAIIDELMVHGDGVQALVAHWEYPLLSQPVATAYESACGIHVEFDLRDWVTRYLRGVSKCLWLGPELLTHLGSTTPIEAIATTTPVGGGMRIVLEDDDALGALEHALAPILPTPEDARVAWDRVWGRR